MKTTCKSMLALLLFPSLQIGAGIACQPPEEIPEIPAECRDDVILNDDNGDEGPSRQGQIKLIQRSFPTGLDAAAMGIAGTTVGAIFVDLSHYTGSSQAGIELSGNCVGLTGQPSPSQKYCEYTNFECEQDADCDAGVECRDKFRLDVKGVRVTGLADGEINLDQMGMGSFVKAGLNRLFGTDTIDMYVTASTDTTTHRFVQSDGSLQSIPPPEAVNLISPDISGGASIGRDDLLMQWQPGADPDKLVYITMLSEQHNVASPDIKRNVSIACVAFDDGCQTLWGSSLSWLMQPDAEWQIGERVTVIISRINKMSVSLEHDTADTELSASLTAELRGEMTP